MSNSSKIFMPNRALGYVSNHIPLVSRYIRNRKENIIATSVGKSFHSYGVSHFSLLAVSALHSDEITCLAGDTFHVYTACNNNAYAWRRGTELKHSYIGHDRPIHLLLPFGPHLLSVDEDSNFKAWDIKSEEVLLQLTFDNNTFNITTICHPSTYINKILFGSEQGQMQLWNIKSSKLIYCFEGWNSTISVLEQAPAIDVIAVGLTNGKIILHNLKFNETVMEFIQDWGPVTIISFRTDGNPIMATGSLVGHVVFWNLEERKVASQLLSCHEGAVTGMCCLPNEPLMVTTSPDNSLKLWIFDMPDGGARLLRLREGHSAPPSYIKFHGNNGQNIVTAGGDSSLRIFNTLSETANKSLGRASYNRKLAKKKGKVEAVSLQMPPITQFASETTREKEWDNIAAIHLGLPDVTTWSFDKQKMGELKFYPKMLSGQKSNLIPHFTATSVCLTSCGNFVVIGYSTGNVERFNIQSGIHRCSYGVPTAHKGAVRGVQVDTLNQITITGGSDGFIRFWYFKMAGKPPLKSLNVNEAVTFFQNQKENSLLCAALDDFSLTLIDIETKTIVRHFRGHTGQITDAAFSPDSRWLISSAMDCSIRIWDIPSAQLVDWFQVDSPCTSLTLSPTGEYLATTHVNYLGIFLWSNKMLFSHVSLKPVLDNSSIPVIQLPSTEIVHDLAITENEEIDDTADYISPDQIADDLVTLSLAANSRWQNLLDIDIVKKRNKPLAPPTVPKAAPFFIPTLPSLNLQFDFNAVNVEDGTKTISLQNIQQNYTVFGQILFETSKSNDFTKAIDKLKSMGPSAVDFEVNSIALESGGSVELMLQFMKMVNFILNSNRDFELGQAYLGLFLKIHGDFISNTPELLNYINELKSAQLTSWNRIQEKLFYTLSVVDHLKYK